MLFLSDSELGEQDRHFMFILLNESLSSRNTRFGLPVKRLPAKSCVFNFLQLVLAEILLFEVIRSDEAKIDISCRILLSEGLLSEIACFQNSLPLASEYMKGHIFELRRNM